jgi:sigma-B regulation protein RsbU (phosphoserine phosphatase)
VDPLIDTHLRSQLLDRQKRLQSAVAGGLAAAHLTNLLREVDQALERMKEGTYGNCDVCHDYIEPDRLLADPLCRNCLDHLTDAQRKALEEDLDLAYQIQSALLPKKELAVNGWRVAHHYEPLGPVSGDYCDLIVPPDQPGTVYFLFGDVSGKGVAASILMSHLHAIFRSLVVANHPVDQLTERANRLFAGGTLATHFATLVCGRATSSGEVAICNAGHCPPLLIQGKGVTRIQATGLPIGLFAQSQFASTNVTLAPGDTLLLYTDGLTESRNPSNVEYGEDRLRSFVGHQGSIAPKELVAACLHDLATFRYGAPRLDDLTVMAIQRER